MLKCIKVTVNSLRSSTCTLNTTGEYNRIIAKTSEVKLVNLRAEDFFKIKNLLDVVDLFFPRRSSAGVSVLPSHGAALPAQVRPTLGYGRRGESEEIKTEECVHSGE